MSVASLAPLDATASAEPNATRSLRISRVTIAVSAVVLAYVDGFWVTSLQRAVGSVGSNQAPFFR